jgi:hypothetical protein
LGPVAFLDIVFRSIRRLRFLEFSDPSFNAEVRGIDYSIRQNRVAPDSYGGNRVT